MKWMKRRESLHEASVSSLKAISQKVVGYLDRASLQTLSMYFHAAASFPFEIHGR